MKNETLPLCGKETYFINNHYLTSYKHLYGMDNLISNLYEITWEIKNNFILLFLTLHFLIFQWIESLEIRGKPGLYDIKIRD